MLGKTLNLIVRAQTRSLFNRHMSSSFTVFMFFQPLQSQHVMSFAPTPLTLSPQMPTLQSSPVEGGLTNVTNETINAPIAAQEWQTYENLSDGIHIDHPATWEKTQLENNLIFLAPPDPSSPNGSLNPGVGIIEEPSLGMTLDSYANKSTSDVQSRIPSGSFVVLENVLLPGFKQGIDALKSVYQWKDTRGGGLIKTMEIYLVTPDKAYTISYAAPVPLFDKYLPVAQRMIDSFQPVPLVSGQGITGNATQLAPFSNVTGTGAAEGPQFATYQNSSFGSLQYPSNWTVDSGGGSVYLAAPLPANEGLNTEAVGFFPLDTLPNPNEPIDKFFSEQFNNFKNTYPTYILADGPFPTTVSGNPAMKARFTSIERNNIPYDSLQIWTTNQDKSKAFRIDATSKMGLYPSFPSAHMQRIIDSFQMASPLSPPVNNNTAFQGVNPNVSSHMGMDMESGNYSTYSNTTSGITVQYPSNWGIDDLKLLIPTELKSS